MTDEDLIGYLLKALTPAERTAVEVALRTNPATAARLEQLRLAFSPLQADAEVPMPAPGLALRTIVRLAEHLVEHHPSAREPSGESVLVAAMRAVAEMPAPDENPMAFPSARLPRAPRDEPEARAVGGRIRPDLFVALAIGFVACGLGFGGIMKFRENSRRIDCQNHLAALHKGLSGYADTHQGSYPRAETRAIGSYDVSTDPTASAFQTLAASGQAPPGWIPCCPSTRPAPSGVGYTYTLGYRTSGGDVVGLRRNDLNADEHDLIPISADYPTPAAAPGPGPMCPHRGGMNVLYLGGNVRFTTSGHVGPAGDDIFRNLFGNVAAGTARTDVVLGRPGDVP